MLIPDIEPATKRVTAGVLSAARASLLRAATNAGGTVSPILSSAPLLRKTRRPTGCLSAW